MRWVGILSGTCICGVLLLLVDRKQEQQLFYENSVLKTPGDVPLNPIDLEWLGCAKQGESFYERDLQQALVYMSNNTRPDAHARQTQCLVGLKGSFQTRLVEPQQKIYLYYDQGHLAFSQQVQPLWIKFKSIEENVLYYDAGMVLMQEETHELYQETLHNVAERQTEAELDQGFLQESYFHDVENAAWWRPDVLYETYGGKEFEAFKGCHRLAFGSSSKEAREVCFVKPQSILLFKDRQWSTNFLEGEETQGHPIAQVLSITPMHMEIKVWDVSGMHSKQVSLTPQRIKPLNIKLEEVFLQIRQRTLRQVFCKVGTKHMLLKAGDWLLHVDNQWKLLKTPEEIERYLSLQLEGELFVFEGIEKNQGNTIFKGRFFDTMREQMQAVSIPIAAARCSLKRDQATQELSQQGATPPQIHERSAPAEVEDELLRLTNTQKRHELSKER